jgi:integrin beta 1
MEDDKDMVTRLGDTLSDSMRNVTTNFRLGFGSFVDKESNGLQKLCDGCVAAYGFKNHLPLNSDTRMFSVSIDGSLSSVK